MDPQVRCEVIYDWASPTYYFNGFLFKHTLTHDKIEQTNGCEHSECHGPQLHFVLGLPPKDNFWK
jgi:hypothetical protein